MKGVPTVGDSLRDLQAGFVLGCMPYLVLTGKGEKTREKGGLPPGTKIYPDLAAMVDHLLNVPAAAEVAPADQAVVEEPIPSKGLKQKNA
jgi:D-glycero-D-manno-heptose 1,7-bisphosphate phosphatase